ncbi:hypothetical protein [Bradyrhizobium sp. Ec3.3]|uniref:bestrophin-like domain n=1 Tax=Bradyrhizobium sp. Ec3.3 TaxID=189753 RepID=UPI00041EDF80
MMAQREVSLKATPSALAEALQLVVAMTPQGTGQATVQRELINALEQALDARRQRIIISLTAVNAVKWWCLYLQAACALVVIGLVHCDNRLAATIAMGLFATGVSASVLLIAAHDRPFAGQISIGPESLLQIMPEKPDKQP